MVHALVALTVVIALYPLGLSVEGALLVAAFYAGREHAQAEYRAIINFYGGKRKNAPWWCGFEPRAWDIKSLLDWLAPVILAICVLVY